MGKTAASTATWKKPKKKGRPSRADLSRRRPSPPESDTRRSQRLHGRRFREESDDDDEEDSFKREKKLKLVLKLPPRASYKAGPATAPLSPSSREIDGDDGSDDGVSAADQGGNQNDVQKSMECDPGTPSDSPSRAAAFSLPDRKLLETILDRIQKKDTYGVYAEPVDPNELPDYHEVIEHPMDFGTIRKKLANGSYTTLEQFENDVYLVCSNAMRYNAPDTIYFKQARIIQEMATKKFERLRISGEVLEVDITPAQKTTSNSLVRKPIKKSFDRTVQEPVGSDFSSGATLATTGDTGTNSTTAQAGGFEKPDNVDGFVDGNSFLADSKPEKAEEISVKGFPSKLGRKPFVLDENRRATYNISNQPVVRAESVFTTFEGETKHLVSVGLHADHSYARSLARFAAALGPVAWRVASLRIEQALPSGFKFGRGWVGEYEPLPTPVLLLENHMQSQPVHGTKLYMSQSKNDEKSDKELKPTQDSSPKNVKLGLGIPSNSSMAAAASTKTPRPANESPFSGGTSVGKSGLFDVFCGTKSNHNVINQQQKSPLTMDVVKPVTNVFKQVEALEMVSRKRNPVQSVPFEQPEAVVLQSNHHTSRSLNCSTDTGDGVVPRQLPNGKAANNSDSNSVISSPLGFVRTHQAEAPHYFSRDNHEQGLNDPVKLMRMLSAKMLNQSKPSNSPLADNSQLGSPIPSSRRDESNAATSAARAWMSIGAADATPTNSPGLPKMQIAAASLYNPTRELPTAVSRFREDPLPLERNRFASQVLQQPADAAGEELRSQNSRLMGFPQPVAPTDLSRFHKQSPWRSLVSHSQPKQKTDMLPPDLNIGFQSPESPVRQHSSILVDSQQPDLALQL